MGLVYVFLVSWITTYSFNVEFISEPCVLMSVTHYRMPLTTLNNSRKHRRQGYPQFRSVCPSTLPHTLKTLVSYLFPLSSPHSLHVAPAPRHPERCSTWTPPVPTGTTGHVPPHLCLEAAVLPILSAAAPLLVVVRNNNRAVHPSEKRRHLQTSRRPSAPVIMCGSLFPIHMSTWCVNLCQLIILNLITWWLPFPQAGRNGSLSNSLGPCLSGIPGYPSTLSFPSRFSLSHDTIEWLHHTFAADDFQLSTDLAGNIVSFNSQGIIHNWTGQNNSQQQLHPNSGGGIGVNQGSPGMQHQQLSVSSPPPQASSSSSSSPSSSIKVKSEPISPPRDLSHHPHMSLSRATSSNTPSHLSPGHPPLTPSSSSSPDPSGSSDYDEGPIHKRIRVSGTDASWPAWLAITSSSVDYHHHRYHH